MREIQLSEDGMLNPDADIPCGAIDPNKTLPEPIHIGGCSSCRKIIHEMLMLRYQRFLDVEKQASKKAEKDAKRAQIPGPWLDKSE